jgi:hypothetical protein
MKLGLQTLFGLNWGCKHGLDETEVVNIVWMKLGL